MFFYSPENAGPMDSSMTTSSEQVLPSPTKVLKRKSRHRRSNSKGSLSSILSGPGKSPTKEALHNELEITQMNVEHSTDMDISPSVFRYLGPGTALRDKCNKHKFCNKEECLNEKNLNDVCFGCDGGCSDHTCSSKRSSRASADVESNVGDDSPCSPTPVLYDIVENQNIENQTQTSIREKDSNENLNSSLESDTRITTETSFTTNTTTTTTTTTETTNQDNILEDNVNKSIKRTSSDPQMSPKRSHNSFRLDNIDAAEAVVVQRRERKFRPHKVKY